MTVRADVIIPFHGQSAMLLRCLSALAAGPRIAGTVFLVDDASPVADRYHAERALSGSALPVCWLQLPQRSGFVAAVNAGWRQCRSAVAVMLNSDTVAAANVLSELVAAIERDPTIAAASPASDNRIDLYQFRESFRPAGAGVGLTAAPYLTAMCLALRRSAVFGPVFDASFSPGYFEDLDLSCRLRANGWRLVVLENCRVHHAGRATFGHHPNLHQIVRRNYALFASRWSKLPEHTDLTQLLGLAPKVGAFQ